MASVTKGVTIKEFQSFVREVYALPNDRHFELAEMLNNIQRFAMRGLKGIRKGDTERTKKNLMISLSWFISTLNRLHIDLEEEIWQRFPYICSYCGSLPCACKSKKVKKRIEIRPDHTKRPKTLEEFQQMFKEIYPPSTRLLDHAGVHLAEEIGEFSEALIAYRGERKAEDFKKVLFEAADCFSCLAGIFNSMEVSLADELVERFSNGCHECHQAPCTCSYNHVKEYKI